MARFTTSAIAQWVASPDAVTADYALKVYGGSMLAYFLALRIGLQNPYWAVATCVITSAPAPLAGAIISKAVYRALGTLMGGAAVVFLVPTFVNEPIVLSFCMGCWIGLCVYFSLQDRTPRSYVFVAAGLTAGIIGFQSVDVPTNVFNNAILREQEIMLGILSASFVHGAIFPRTLTARLLVRVEQILQQARSVSGQALKGVRDPGVEAARTTLALEANELRGFAVQLPYDTARLQPRVQVLNALQDQLLLLLPVLGALEDRLVELSRIPQGLSPALTSLIAQCGDWLDRGFATPESAAVAARLRAELSNMLTCTADGDLWRRMLTLNVLARLHDFLQIHEILIALQDGLRHPSPKMASATIDALVASTPATSFYRDRITSGWIGFAAGATVFAGCIFWIETAWPAGSRALFLIAVELVSVAAVFPAAPKVLRMLLAAAIGAVCLGGLYGYVILPRVTEPIMLALVLAPLYLTGAAFLSRPATGLIGLSGTLIFTTTVGLSSSYQHDFSSYANTAVSLVIGTCFTAWSLSFAQVGTAAAAAIRLRKAAYRDVASRAVHRLALEAPWANRMLDRVGRLVTHEYLSRPDSRESTVDLLTDMRTGHLAGELLALRDSADVDDKQALDVTLEKIAQYYQALNPKRPTTPPAELLEAIDRGVRTFGNAREPAIGRQGLILLAGLRRNLFPNAGPYQALPAP